MSLSPLSTTRSLLLLILPIAACGPDAFEGGDFSGEEDLSTYSYLSLVTLDPTDLTDTGGIRFPYTYRDDADYFLFAGNTSCSTMAANTALGLITIARQLHHDTVNTIDRTGVYRSGQDKRLYIDDMGGCPECNPSSRYFSRYAYHHDAGSNFHQGTQVADFLYFTREASNCTQGSCGYSPRVTLYQNGALIEERVDWLRIALFVKYLNELFPRATIFMGSQLEQYVSTMLRTSDPSLRSLLRTLRLEGTTLRVTPDDNYQHPYHMHVSFSGLVNWSVLGQGHWYFHSSSLDCVDHVCAGNNSFVDEIRHPSGISNWSGLAPEDYKRYCCNGDWRIDASATGNPSDWINGCSTGWRTVGVVGTPRVTPWGVDVSFASCSSGY